MAIKHGKPPLRKPGGARREARRDGSRDVRLDKLEREVSSLKNVVAHLRSSQSLVVLARTLAPEPFELLKDIPVVIQRSDDEYVASFFDANINASGGTETDAVANFKDVLLAVFERLEKEPTERLGPGPARQLAVLREFVRRRDPDGQDHHEGAGKKDREEAAGRNRIAQKQGP